MFLKFQFFLFFLILLFFVSLSTPKNTFAQSCQIKQFDVDSCVHTSPCNTAVFAEDCTNLSLWCKLTGLCKEFTGDQCCSRVFEGGTCTNRQPAATNFCPSSLSYPGIACKSAACLVTPTPTPTPSPTPSGCNNDFQCPGCQICSNRVCVDGSNKWCSANQICFGTSCITLPTPTPTPITYQYP